MLQETVSIKEHINSINIHRFLIKLLTQNVHTEGQQGPKFSDNMFQNGAMPKMGKQYLTIKQPTKFQQNPNILFHDIEQSAGL